MTGILGLLIGACFLEVAYLRGCVQHSLTVGDQ